MDRELIRQWCFDDELSVKHGAISRGAMLPLLALLLLGLFPKPTCAQGTTVRVSVSSNGVQGNGASDVASVSDDGRFVAFASDATNLVPGDTNGYTDVFVRDRRTGQTTRVSVDSNGAQGNGNSGNSGSGALSLSADGGFVVFDSYATNLVPGSTSGVGDVFVHDLSTGQTTLVSVDSVGVHGNGFSSSAAISADGRFVSFWSSASNLVLGDTNNAYDVFVHDRQTGQTTRVSVDSNGAQGNSHSQLPFISTDGRYVVFQSLATNLVPGDTNGYADVFVHDRQTGQTNRVSVDSSGLQGNEVSGYYRSSISADGRYAVFESIATNLVPGDTNGSTDIFVHDNYTGETDRVSVDSSGGQVNSDSQDSFISANGRYVSFESGSPDLVPGDTNGDYDVFVSDRLNGQISRVSVASSGAQGNNFSGGASISADGRYVAFISFASNLVSGDTNGFSDIFVHDLNATGFTSLCDPGVGEVIACPCSNPPSGLGRGCDNSSGTGGAVLSASGIAYLTSDSLVFTTSDEKQNALSVVLQGNAGITSGVVYGQGVRCAGGTVIRRLYIQQAVGGSITSPDFGAGDPTVSARSAAKGDVIQPGQSRWYLVYYRDPVVLGGCPASSTFNATQTGRIDWSP